MYNYKKETIKGVDICLIDFQGLLNGIESQCALEFLKYDLVDCDKNVCLRDSTTKRIIQHSIIYSICKAILNYKEQSRVIILIPKCLNYDIFKYYTNFDHFCVVFEKLLKSATKRMPVNTHYIDKQVELMTSSEYQYCLIDIYGKIFNKYKICSLNQIKKYAKRNGLVFLYNEYFNMFDIKIITQHV